MTSVKWGRVVICDMWGLGADHCLIPPLGGNLEFWLRPRFIQGADGSAYLANYAVDFSPGCAPDGWAGAIFTPMGTKDVEGICDLPPWNKSQHDAYKKVLCDDTTNNLGKSNTRRLESIIPYVDDAGNLGYNTVRLFYVPNARQAPTKHLFVIKTATHELAKGGVRGLQDGTGHGPPD